ncbi:hypothetical protein LNK82_17880 [Saccharothrix sp. NEAU-S10]|nr:hypothetical protein [Saccharothrix luteola]MCC8246151.1 hypothetical protein [Saccharothrix luteola]
MPAASNAQLACAWVLTATVRLSGRPLPLSTSRVGAPTASVVKTLNPAGPQTHSNRGVRASPGAWRTAPCAPGSRTARRGPTRRSGAIPQAQVPGIWAGWNTEALRPEHGDVTITVSPWPDPAGSRCS